MKVVRVNAEEYSKKSKGLGDTIKKVTDTLGIPQCGGCKARQRKLNALFPYKSKEVDNK